MPESVTNKDRMFMTPWRDYFAKQDWLLSFGTATGTRKSGVFTEFIRGRSNDIGESVVSDIVTAAITLLHAVYLQSIAMTLVELILLWVI